MHCTYIISQVLSIVNCTLAHNRESNKAGFVQALRDECLIDDAGHGEGIVARHESKVVDGGISDYARFGGREDQRHVALGKMVSVRDGIMEL